jgi:isopentenyl phosphate kinase
MDQLVKLVSQKTGINESQAKMAVDTVMSFMKDKLPDGMASQVISMLQDGSDTGNDDIASGLKGKLGGLFGS